MENWQLPCLWSLSRSAQGTCRTLEAYLRAEERGKKPGAVSLISVLLVRTSSWARVVRERRELRSPVVREGQSTKYGLKFIKQQLPAALEAGDCNEGNFVPDLSDVESAQWRRPAGP